MSDQLDIFGQVVESIEPEAVEQPKVSQPHLFEPQMEGQLEMLATSP